MSGIDFRPRPALGFALAYGCFWGIQRAAAFDVHEIAFSPLLIATAILAVDRQKWVLFRFLTAGMILIKEDHIPLVGAFGMYLLIRNERRVASSPSWRASQQRLLVVGIVIPTLSDTGASAYTSPYVNVLTRPWLLPLTLVTPLVKVETAVLWFAPFAMLSLFSPLAILVVPLALTRFLSDSPTHWGPVFHYSAPLAPIIAMSAADGLARIVRHFTRNTARRLVAAAATASVILSAFLPGRQPLWRVFAPAHYAASEAATAGRAVLRTIPPEASIVAQAAIVPHLSMRDRVYVLDGRAPDADYVVVCESLSPWPAGRFDELKLLVQTRQAKGYKVAIQQEGWTVLRR